MDNDTMNAYTHTTAGMIETAGKRPIFEKVFSTSISNSKKNDG